MKTITTLLVLAATASTAAADGPYSHSSNGVTQPIKIVQGNQITYVECVAGSRCRMRTGTTTLAANATQTMSVWLQTGSSVTTDHFGFGVRGNPTNSACMAPTDPNALHLLSNPYWGRGLVIEAGTATKTAKFENFTLSCVGPTPANNTALVQSSGQTISFLPNTQYMITVSANDVNVWYDIEKRYYNAQDQAWDFIPIASGDCLAQASAAEDYKCAALPQDLASANRTFVGSLTDLVWSVSNWYIY